MFSLVRGAFVAVMMGMLTVAASAQGTISVPDRLLEGSTVTIGFSDPDRANQTVIIEIDDGSLPTPNTQELVIHLDANGNGTAEWTVPNWDWASFNTKGAQEVTRGISW